MRADAVDLVFPGLEGTQVQRIGLGFLYIDTRLLKQEFWPYRAHCQLHDLLQSLKPSRFSPDGCSRWIFCLLRQRRHE